MVYTKEKNVGVTREFEVPKDIFGGLHYPLTWSNKICGGRGKNDAMVKNGSSSEIAGDYVQEFLMLTYHF